MEDKSKLAIEIVGGAVGLIGLAVAIIFVLRFSKHKRSAKWSPTTVGLKSTIDQKIPVSVVVVPTQMAASIRHTYHLSPPEPVNIKAVHQQDNGKSCKRDGNVMLKVLTNFKKDQSYGSLKNELYKGESSTGSDLQISINSSNADDEVEGEEQVRGDRSPKFLPEQWSTPTFTTTAEFTVTYVNSSNVLAVHVTRLINLPNWKPFKSSNSHRIKIKLLHISKLSTPYLTPPTSMDSPVPKKSSATIRRWSSHSSVLSSPTGGQSIKKTFDFENGAFFAFTGYSLPELKSYYLSILLYEYKTLREKQIGECTCILAQLELEAETSVKCMEEVKLKQKVSSSEKSLGKGSRGQLLLSLFYQPEANRMKIIIRKATDLPKKKLPGLVYSEYGVIVNSIYGGQIMATQETKKIHGRTPVWNQPFILDIPEKNLERYSLQFIAFSSSGVNQPHHTIGHVVIGPDVRGDGHNHWLEATQPKPLEATMWHKLEPLL